MLSQCASRCSTLTVRISISWLRRNAGIRSRKSGNVKSAPGVIKRRADRDFDGDREEAFAGEAITPVLTDEIDISRGDLLLAADEALPAVQSASVDVVWMAEQPLPRPEL